MRIKSPTSRFLPARKFVFKNHVIESFVKNNDTAAHTFLLFTPRSIANSVACHIAQMLEKTPQTMSSNCPDYRSGHNFTPTTPHTLSCQILSCRQRNWETSDTCQTDTLCRSTPDQPSSWREINRSIRPMYTPNHNVFTHTHTHTYTHT